MKLVLSVALLSMLFGAPPQRKPSPGACDHAAPPAGMRWSCDPNDTCDCRLVPAGPGEGGGPGQGGIAESPAAAGQCLACSIDYFVVPAYPAAARKGGIQGNVSASLALTTEGTVQRVRITSGNPELAKAATTAFQQWRFRAGGELKIVPVSVKFVLAENPYGSATGTSLLNLVVTAAPIR